MARVRIVTDSAARFSTPDFLHRHPVTVAPMTLRCGAVTLTDDPYAELAAAQALFDACDPPPVAEPPTVDAFTEVYTQLQKDASHIVSIHTSSLMTGTYENARQASQSFLGRCNIQVLDSQAVSLGLGLLVRAAAEAAARDAPADEIVRIVRGMIPRLYTVFFLDDMAYLERNRLVSRSQAILGNMLGVIPFLTIEDGRIVAMEKVRSRTRALEKLLEFVTEFSTIEHLALLHSQSLLNEETRQVVERLQGMHPGTPLSVLTYGPSLATFVGPNALGIVVLEAEEEGL
jgi:DegV family protein with EDD domain